MIETIDDFLATIRRAADRIEADNPDDSHNTGIVFGMRLVCDELQSLRPIMKV